MTDRPEPPTVEQMRARIAEVHARRGGTPPAARALQDQLLQQGSVESDRLIKMALNMRIALETNHTEIAVDMAKFMVDQLMATSKRELVNVVRELVIRVTKEITKGYGTMAEFRAALAAGEVDGYVSKTPEELDRDLLGVPPDQA